ncbi:MAG: dihydroneopterin aldolase [candidate division Zixibacteria bacterium]|jgi:dihydroneopterin aldolase|nr:dihydroneopterin aldolase [candidate division Zixibacteria bacterium]
MSDVIRMGGLSFYGYHGVTAAEKETGRVFEIDCEMEVDLAQPGKTDRLKDTVDYYRVYQVIKESVEGTAYSLLEGLANRIATNILDMFPVYRVTLKVRKLHPPIPGQVKFIEVEVTRHQGDTAKLTDPDHQPT